MQMADSWIRDIPQQFLGKKNIEVLIRAFARQLQELQDVFDDLDTKVDLDVATGQNLDYVGTIIPLSRKEAGELAGLDVIEPVISDERYRQYLRYKLLQNTSECTYYDIMKAIEILWDVTKCSYYERIDRPATIFIRLPSVDIEEEDPAKGKPTILKPSGVGFYYTVQYITVFDHVGLEQIALRNVRFKLGIPFWYERTFDGSWLLDGSVLLDSKRRYGLALGIRSGQWGFHTSWRNHLCSVRFCKAKVETPETVSARARFRFGFDFWETRYFDGSWLLDGSVLLYPWRYGLSLGISQKLLIDGNTEEIRMRSLSARWELHNRENMTASVKTILEAESLTDHKREKMAFIIRLEVDHSEQEAVGNVTVETKSPDYWFFDGKFLLDGTRKLNSIYKKEEI